mmetsp:Transcript_29075/g.86089  ORF Transcript_29075/g.86089 Transcript_29075/m.86089 type:complete len:202 (+) Transcript_29075:1236-1841(+)|eukprot:364552-Chlamydomonas_euryale.AAC.7
MHTCYPLLSPFSLCLPCAIPAQSLRTRPECAIPPLLTVHCYSTPYQTRPSPGSLAPLTLPVSAQGRAQRVGNTLNPAGCSFSAASSRRCARRHAAHTMLDTAVHAMPLHASGRALLAAGQACPCMLSAGLCLRQGRRVAACFWPGFACGRISSKAWRPTRRLCCGPSLYQKNTIERESESEVQGADPVEYAPLINEASNQR